MVHLERIGIGGVLLTYAFGGYFWIGLSTGPAPAAGGGDPERATDPFRAAHQWWSSRARGRNSL